MFKLLNCVSALLVTLACVTPAPAQKKDGAPPPVPEGLRHVPADALGFAHLRVADLASSKTGKRLIDELVKGEEVAGALAKVEKHVGLSLRDVDSITLLVLARSADSRRDDELIWRRMAEEQRARAEAQRALAERAVQEAIRASDEKKADPPEQPECGGDDDFAGMHPDDAWLTPGVIVTMKKAIDRTAVVRYLGDEEGEDRGGGVLFLSDHALLISTPLMVRRYVDTISRRQPEPLAWAMTLGSDHVLLAAGRIPASLRHLLQRENGMVAALYPLLTVQSAVLAIDLAPTPIVRMQLRGANERNAALASQAAKTLITAAGLHIARRLNDDIEDAKLRGLVTDLQKALAKVEIKQEDTMVHVTMRMDIDSGQLITLAQLLGGQVQLNTQRDVSVNNLKQIALALHNYHDVYNAFPPAHIVGNDGKPLLSWRVAILPYIEQENLYQQFDLNLPWDHPKNKKAAAAMPSIYAAPGKKAAAGMTYYQVLVGPGTPFEPLRGVTKMRGRSMAHITDGTSNTVMVVEAGEPVLWSKPDDVPFDPKKPAPKLGGIFGDGFNAAFCDGSVRFISRKVSDETLRLLIQANDGMVITEEALRGQEDGRKKARDVPAKSS